MPNVEWLQDRDEGYEREFSFGEVRAPDHDLEHQVIAMLKTHGPREGEALAQYQKLAEETEDGAHAYLMRLILEDERRHHRTIEEMLNAVQGFVWELDIETSTPAAVRRPNEHIHDETTRLLAFEREDAKELRELKKALRKSKAWSVHLLLVDLMLKDTEKHITILKYIQRLTKP